MLLVKGVTETIKNEAKEQKAGFLGILLGTLGASLIGNLLTGTETIVGDEDTIRPGVEQARIFNVTSSFNKF